MVRHEHMSRMHFTSKVLDRSMSESDIFGISMESVADGFPPMVKDAPSAFFCTLYREIELPGSKTVPLILRIESHYLN
jgi:hypothetical protein